ncbi:MAG: hypothetical protein LC799_06855 [Actinobacteria bacterium]|nr:hypothetical protein [Actinomycetota bacterium]
MRVPSRFLSFIDVHEIFFKGEELRPEPGLSLEAVYGLQLVMYVVLAAVITAAMRVLETLAARRTGRNVPSTKKAFATVAGVGA